MMPESYPAMTASLISGQSPRSSAVMMTARVFTKTNEDCCGYQPSEFLASRDPSRPPGARPGSRVAAQKRNDVRLRRAHRAGQVARIEDYDQALCFLRALPEVVRKDRADVGQ